MISGQVLARQARIAEQFQRAEPFRHVVIDQFLQPEVAARLLAEFPEFDPNKAINENGKIGRKAVCEQLRGLGPSYSRLDDCIQGTEFLGTISAITGIPDLLYDPHYFGGGTHDNRDGQGLDPHVDFNRHPLTHTHRRLNLIVYLNPGWQAEWGGVFELHRDPHADDDEIVAVMPLYNRAVIFETTERSWHGFSRISLPGARQHEARRSIALYFYSAARPSDELAATHSTVYVDRPLPSHLVAGMTLGQADVDELQCLLRERDQHIQRLYRDEQHLNSKLEQTMRAVGLVRGSRVFRALAFLRRTLRSWLGSPPRQPPDESTRSPAERLE